MINQKLYHPETLHLTSELMPTIVHFDLQQTTRKEKRILRKAI